MWITVKEYAARQGISPQAVRKRIKAGHIPPERIRKNDAGRIEIQERSTP